MARKHISIPAGFHFKDLRSKSQPGEDAPRYAHLWPPAPGARPACGCRWPCPRLDQLWAPSRPGRTPAPPSAPARRGPWESRAPSATAAFRSWCGRIPWAEVGISASERPPSYRTIRASSMLQISPRPMLVTGDSRALYWSRTDTLHRSEQHGRSQLASKNPCLTYLRTTSATSPGFCTGTSWIASSIQ